MISVQGTVSMYFRKIGVRSGIYFWKIGIKSGIHFGKIGKRSGIYFWKIGIKSGIHFGKIGTRNGYVLKLRWQVPVQNLVKYPPPPRASLRILSSAFENARLF